MVADLTVGILGCREAGGVKLHVERMVGNFRCVCVCGRGGGVGGVVVACFVTTARFVILSPRWQNVQRCQHVLSSARW